MKNVSVAIDHVAVSGLPTGTRNTAAIGRGIESALGRILAERGVAGLTEGEVPRVSITDLRLAPGATEVQIAEAVASAVHGALNGKR